MGSADSQVVSPESAAQMVRRAATLIHPDSIVSFLRAWNEALPEGHPAKLTREMRDAAGAALDTLHGPKLDGPRNDTERGLLYLGEALDQILGPPG